MATVCPGAPPSPLEPTPTADITTCATAPQPTYAPITGGANPAAHYLVGDGEMCSVHVCYNTAVNGSVPQWLVELNWLSANNVNENITGGGGTAGPLAASFGVGPNGIITTGNVGSVTCQDGTKATVTVISGSAHVDTPSGSTFGINPGEFPGQTFCYRIDFDRPVHLFGEIYDNTETYPGCPAGSTNWQASIAVAQTITCDGATGTNQTSTTLHSTINGIRPGDQVRWRYGTTLGGPYPTTLGPIPAVAGSGNSTPVGGLTPGTQYFWVADILNAGNIVQATSPECTFTTTAAPPPRTATCNAATAVTTTTATLNGTVGGIQAGDTYEFHYGTTFGGPYPTVIGPNPAANGPVSGAATGLTPGTAYYYIVIVKDSGSVTQATSAQCTFTTVAATRTVTCDPATAISQTGAQLNATGGNIQAGDQIRWRYGTVNGGPYGTTLGPIPAVNGTNSTGVGGLNPGTTYYVVVDILDSGNLVKATSTQCQFTTASPPPVTASTSGPTGVTSTCITFNGNSNNAPAGCTYSFVYGTTPGGPYNQTVPGTPGTSTGASPETFSATVCGLVPGTTYYHRAKVVCSGTPHLGNEQFATTGTQRTAQCEPADSITPTSANLNGFIGGLSVGDQYEFQYGTTPGGPYPTTLGPFAATPAGQKTQAATGLTPNTNYYFKIVVLDNTSTVQATSSECSFKTAAQPVGVTTDPATGVTTTCITFHGTATNSPAGCSYKFKYGKNPGGPYDNTVQGTPPLSTGTSPESFSATVCGLTPGTNYHYVAVVSCPDPGHDSVGQDQPVTTTPIIVDPCEAPTSVTSTSATLHGTATGAPAGYTFRFRYSTTPGGPYDHTVPAGTSNGVSPEAYAANISGLVPNTTYYYISEVLNPQQEVVAGGGQCTFTTTGPTLVEWCGGLFDTTNCTLVTTPNESYFNCQGGQAFVPPPPAVIPTPPPRTLADVWDCNKVTLSGNTWTNPNFANAGIVVTETITPITGSTAIAGCQSIEMNISSPATQHHHIDLGAPRTNVTISWGNFGAGDVIKNVTPAFNTLAGSATPAAGNTEADGVGAPNNMGMTFAGPIQFIDYDYTPTGPSHGTTTGLMVFTT